MDDYFRYGFLGLTAGLTCAVAVLGATWPGVAALGILALISIALQEAHTSKNRAELCKRLEKQEEYALELSKRIEKADSALTSLQVNKGITTRRL